MRYSGGVDKTALQEFIAGLNEVAEGLRQRGAGKTIAFQAHGLFEPIEGKALVHASDAKDGKPGKLIVHGKVADFDWDREDEIFEPGAFDKGLEEFKKNPIMVYSHAKQIMDTVNGPSGYVQIGKWDPDSFEKRADGLYARGEVYEPSSPAMKDLYYSQIERGDMRGASVGGKFTRHRGGDGRVRISKVDLQEISLAPKPVNPRTLMSVTTAS